MIEYLYGCLRFTDGPTLVRMGTPDLQSAVAGEVLAEAARQRISARQLAAEAGVSHSSWKRWFGDANRNLPLDALHAVADVLGVSASELLRRAEEQMEAGTVRQTKAAQRRKSVRKGEDD